MKILRIVKCTMVDGPGFRTSIYTSGCSHYCKGCHNSNSWDINSGKEMCISDIMQAINDASPSGGVTLSGGDPLFQLQDTIELCKSIKASNRNLWVYTGYTFEQIINDDVMKEILPYIDVLVDGKYINSERCVGDKKYIFRGSRNQRLVDVKRSLKENKVIEFEYNPYPNF